MLNAANADGYKVSRTTVRDQAVAKLKAAITAGYLLPGQRLIERDLCELIGVSRTSIREALRLLEGEKLIVAQPHKGPCVAVPSVAEADQIYEVRAVLEALVGRHAASRGTPAQIGAIHRSVDAFERAMTRRDLPGLVEYANEFYERVFEASGDDVAADLLRSLHARISFLRATSMSSSGRAPHSLAEMRAIARAIDRHAPDVAAAACVRHVEMAAKASRRRMAQLAEGNGLAAGQTTRRRKYKIRQNSSRA